MTNSNACWTWLTFLSSQAGTVRDGFPARTSLATSAAFAQQVPAGATEVYKAYRALPRGSSERARADVFDDPRIDLFWFYRAVERALGGKDLERELAGSRLPRKDA